MYFIEMRLSLTGLRQQGVSREQLFLCCLPMQAELLIQTRNRCRRMDSYQDPVPLRYCRHQVFHPECHPYQEVWWAAVSPRYSDQDSPEQDRAKAEPEVQEPDPDTKDM